MDLIEGRLYTPEEVSENRWLGKRTPGALRKAASRGQLQHSMSGGKICFSRADILANQEEARRPAKTRRSSAASAQPRRIRRVPVSAPEANVTALKPRPDAARRRRAS